MIWLYVVFSYLSNYFYIPLAVGVGVLSLQQRSSIGWICVGIGIFGALSGVPRLYGQAQYAYSARKHMDLRCASALEELPTSRLLAEGIVFQQSSDLSGLTVDADKLVDPVSGRFQRVQQKLTINGTDEFYETAWKTFNDTKLSHPVRNQISALSMPYELSIEATSDGDDQAYQVKQIQVRVIERATNKVIARKVFFAQWDYLPKGNAPSRVCPKPRQEERNCESPWDCALAWPFVLRVLEPKIDLAGSELFDLYKGMGTDRHVACHTDILVGPGIHPLDIEWWGGGSEGWEDLYLRMKGSGVSFQCDWFFWQQKPVNIRFANGAVYSTSKLLNAFRGKSKTTPQPLVGLNP